MHSETTHPMKTSKRMAQPVARCETSKPPAELQDGGHEVGAGKPVRVGFGWGRRHAGEVE